jgi:hypothetical protein
MSRVLPRWRCLARSVFAGWFLAFSAVASAAQVEISNASVDLSATPPTVTLHDLEQRFGTEPGQIWQGVDGALVPLVPVSWSPQTVVAELAESTEGSYLITVRPNRGALSGFIVSFSAADGDSDSSNELNQALELDGTVLRLTDAGGTLSAELAGLIDDADADPTNEAIDDIYLLDTFLIIVEGGRLIVVDLRDLVNDADSDPTNELLHSVELIGTELVITDAGGSLSVDLGETFLAKPDQGCYENSFDRFVDCGNGTVTDRTNGLIWLKAANCLGGGTFLEAHDLSRALQEGDCGLTDGSRPGDWRLPTVEEWENILDPTCETAPMIRGNNGCYSEHPDSPWATGVGPFWYHTFNASHNRSNGVWHVLLAAPWGIVIINEILDPATIWPVRDPK